MASPRRYRTEASAQHGGFNYSNARDVAQANSDVYDNRDHHFDVGRGRSSYGHAQDVAWGSSEGCDNGFYPYDGRGGGANYERSQDGREEYGDFYKCGGERGQYNDSEYGGRGYDGRDYGGRGYGGRRNGEDGFRRYVDCYEGARPGYDGCRGGPEYGRGQDVYAGHGEWYEDRCEGARYDGGRYGGRSHGYEAAVDEGYGFSYKDRRDREPGGYYDERYGGRSYEYREYGGGYGGGCYDNRRERGRRCEGRYGSGHHGSWLQGAERTNEVSGLEEARGSSMESVAQAEVRASKQVRLSGRKRKRALCDEDRIAKVRRPRLEGKASALIDEIDCLFGCEIGEGSSGCIPTRFTTRKSSESAAQHFVRDATEKLRREASSKRTRAEKTEGRESGDASAGSRKSKRTQARKRRRVMLLEADKKHVLAKDIAASVEKELPIPAIPQSALDGQNCSLGSALMDEVALLSARRPSHERDAIDYVLSVIASNREQLEQKLETEHLQNDAAHPKQLRRASNEDEVLEYYGLCRSRAEGRSRLLAKFHEDVAKKLGEMGLPGHANLMHLQIGCEAGGAEVETSSAEYVAANEAQVREFLKRIAKHIDRRGRVCLPPELQKQWRSELKSRKRFKPSVPNASDEAKDGALRSIADSANADCAALNSCAADNDDAGADEAGAGAEFEKDSATGCAARLSAGASGKKAASVTKKNARRMRLRKQKRQKDKMQRKGANNEEERGSTEGNHGNSGETNEEMNAKRSFATECAEDASTEAKRAPTLALSLARCMSVGTGSVIASAASDVDGDAEAEAEELEKLSEDDFPRTCVYCKVEINSKKTWETHVAGKKHEKWVSQAKIRKRNEKLFG